MKRLSDIFRKLSDRTRTMDEKAFSWNTKKITDTSWQITIDEGLEPYLRLEEITDPDSVAHTEERATLICDLLNAAPEMTEAAARSQENKDLAQDLLDTVSAYLDALDRARTMTAHSGVSADANQRALIAASRAEDELRALILGSGGTTA